MAEQRAQGLNQGQEIEFYSFQSRQPQNLGEQALVCNDNNDIYKNLNHMENYYLLLDM